MDSWDNFAVLVDAMTLTDAPWQRRPMISARITVECTQWHRMTDWEENCTSRRTLVLGIFETEKQFGGDSSVATCSPGQRHAGSDLSFSNRSNITCVIYEGCVMSSVIVMMFLPVWCLVVIPAASLGGAMKPHGRSRELVAAAALPSSWREDLLAAVNRERTKIGLATLCANDKLNAAAQKHSADMVNNNYLGHTGSSGSTLATRVLGEGFRYSNAGENVAAGQQSVTSVMSDWMNSPGHKANILGNFTYFGAGVAEKATGTLYGIYWTQVFGSSSSEFCACIVK